MPLRQILVDVAQEIGADITNTSERALLVADINRAAQELYDSTDLVGCLREQVFDVDYTQQQLSLPYYIGQLRGVRNYDTASKRKLFDMRPRYFYGEWTPDSRINWRIKHVVPLGRELSQEGPLTFALPAAEATAFKIYVAGATANGDRVVEEVDFTTSDTTKTTTNSWLSFPELRNIEKTAITAGNVTITDDAGVEVGMIANQEYRSRYTIVQISDTTDGEVTDCNCYEILYKLKFSPFYNDYDEFPCEGYDEVIKWMVLANYYGAKDGMEKKAGGYLLRAKYLVAEKDADANKGRELKMEFRPNRFMEACDEVANNLRYRTGWPIN